MRTSASYLLFVFGVAFGIIGVLVYAGYTGWNFWLTFSIGAVVQLLFRIAKRLWRNSLQSSGGPADKPGNAWTRLNVRSLLTAYVTMIVVCALWYGIGWGVGWLAH